MVRLRRWMAALFFCSWMLLIFHKHAACVGQLHEQHPGCAVCASAHFLAPQVLQPSPGGVRVALSVATAAVPVFRPSVPFRSSFFRPSRAPPSA